MSKQPRGLYEVLVTEALESELRQLEDGLEAQRDGLRPAEAADRLALHLSRVIKAVIASVDARERVAVGVALARRLIEEIGDARSTDALAP
ncbi:MAG: hypothetical protein AB1Z98_25290, partial [Nannocystaceae bacterium]